ncbi:caspase family protein [Actinosynnema sp. NPDC047251]|uniref:VWFA domain-containing protein n=1 Tax=Saccharothrix espanaensis (strain ATCC 51144 / DSM 44229 / JCM 9112 / NBRC 15066 / NRRL 15764) TaxID=1179773 RepID=K0K498_SACES|nr:caspase family protein [Saccharothrix espanaensis]CCH33111.1 hypothetical protein BN6_58530 [Saccharothrix espanaensis DSM 44229]
MHLRHPAPKPADSRAALVLANGVYADERLAKLRSPAVDATGMTEVLSDPAIGGFDVTVVSERAESDVRRAVDRFLGERNSDELVVVYLSCHGLVDARGRLYFATADTDRDWLASTAVESRWLLERLDDCRAGRQVLILDCCFSGAFERGAKAGGTEVDLERRLVGGRGRAVLTASGATEYSFEGEALVSQGGSVFTAALVDGLRTGAADRDNTGYITVEDAFQFAADRVREHPDRPQTPQRWLFRGVDSIILARNPLGAAVVPTPLPEHLKASLESPLPYVREGSVRSLGEWLTSAEPGQVLAAHQRLQLVAAEDVPVVAERARELLRSVDTPGQQVRPPAAPPRAPTRVVPLYLVVDVSYSMTGKRIDAVNAAVPEILRQIRQAASGAEVLRFGLIDFGSDAQVVLSMTSEAADTTLVPALRVRGATSYAAAFTLLRERIGQDAARFAATGQEVAEVVIAFLTDGWPTNLADQWKEAYASLVGDAPAPLTVLALGLGDDFEALAALAHVVDDPKVSGRSRAEKTTADEPGLRRIADFYLEVVAALPAAR